MESLPEINDKRFFNSARDDALVYRLNEDLALVQSLDFITPVLNDPYAFGAVAAANALSDIYAMGAAPFAAQNIVGFPVKSLPLSILEDILRGGAAVAAEAGVTVAGGHSIDDNIPKYGMVVTGTANTAQLVYKKGARSGDVLFLTKPLGSGIITTALEREMAGTELEEKIYQVMVHLNRGAANAMLKVGVHACTDITGFGLLGHLHEMLVASNAAAEIQLNKVPVMEEAWEFARAGAVPAGSHNNYRHLKPKITWDEGLCQEARLILSDAQTSGGLLIAVSPEKSDLLQKHLVQEACLCTKQIGRVITGNAGTIVVTG